MFKGETITTAISGLPVSIRDIDNIYLIFRTVTKVILEKTLADCSIDGEVIECTLTQEESLRLSCGPIIRHLIVITKDGARFEHINDELFCADGGKYTVCPCGDADGANANIETYVKVVTQAGGADVAELPLATRDVAGLVKVGNGLNADKNGVLSVDKISQSSVIGLIDALGAKVNAEKGKSLVSDSLISKLMSVNVNAQENVLEGISVDGVRIDVDANKVANIGVATDISAGVVKSTNGENGVTVAADGSMTVNSISISKIIQDHSDPMVFSGGSSET